MGAPGTACPSLDPASFRATITSRHPQPTQPSLMGTESTGTVASQARKVETNIPGSPV